jgi:hypothetical protein
MLKFPMHGFAKGVEDTVICAMLILRAREDIITPRDALPMAPRDQRPGSNEKRQ